jgi:signal transduction histidine kinase
VATAVAGAVLAVASALWALDYERAAVSTAPPFVAPGADALRGSFHAAEIVVFPLFQVVWLACVISRRARATADEARQLRWLIASVALSAVVLLVGIIVSGSPRAGLLTLPLIPLAAGFAIVESAYEALVREVRTATQRVVAAQDDARRQIEQDLHDGAQHRLVVLGMELGRIVDRANEQGDRELAGAAQGARDQLLEATAELRELARGIHPSVLTHDGLVPALESLVERSSVRVDMDIDPIPECDPQVEIAAYYAVSEALTNTVRHGRATRSTVRITSCGEDLRIEVADDGDGGARMGRGLRGLADRVQSVGGRLTLDSSPGAGTRVTVELPCR